MMTLRFSGAVLLFVTLCFGWRISSAQEPASVTFDLPGHGKLLLAVPASWNAEIHPRAGQVPPTLELSQKSGASFHILLTPLWTPSSDTPFPTDALVRVRVAKAAKEAEAQSVEQTLSLKELFGKANRGYYFTATDRAPKPDEWKYLTEGIIRIGAVDLAFSVLTNDGQEATVKNALGMLLAATHVLPTV
jgi:hypothetical protein